MRMKARLKLFDMPMSSSGNKYTELHLAVLNNDLKKLENLLKSGANPDQPDTDQGWTALMREVSNRRLKSIKLLLEYGADPNKAGVYGTTPIMRCMKLARSENYMLGKDCWSPEPDQETYEELVWDANYLTHQIISALLNYGADPSIKDHFGKDAFEHCNHQDHKELLTYLNQVIQPADIVKNRPTSISIR